MLHDGTDEWLQHVCVQRPWKPQDPWPAEAAEACFLSGMCHMEMRSYLPALNSFNSAISQDNNYAEVNIVTTVLGFLDFDKIYDCKIK